ncbi:MAG TPA: hypothetical protein VFP10_08405 [Candidatus Eisenbacteria bacterium]|nr:hypothetical protein [Candidatus Eisenbacteria bacterium]
MTQKIRMAVLALAVFAAAGCGKKESSSTQTDTHSKAAETTHTADAPETTVAPTRDYQTVHDPNAVYGKNDLPGRGSYLKLDFNELSADQLNRVIHRMRSESCTCGCNGEPIDQCLVNDPSCQTAITLANQIMREEKMKS